MFGGGVVGGQSGTCGCQEAIAPHLSRSFRRRYTSWRRSNSRSSKPRVAEPCCPPTIALRRAGTAPGKSRTSKTGNEVRDPLDTKCQTRPARRHEGWEGHPVALAGDWATPAACRQQPQWRENLQSSRLCRHSVLSPPKRWRGLIREVAVLCAHSHACTATLLTGDLTHATAFETQQGTVAHNQAAAWPHQKGVVRPLGRPTTATGMGESGSRAWCSAL